MKKRDGRIIAAENEMRVLRSLHRFGWLRSRDLAALRQRWLSRPVGEPDFEPVVATASALRMVQRTLRRLIASRQVLRGQAPNGSALYALAEAGARRLRCAGVSASSGKDLIRSFSAAQFLHRSIANQIAIHGIVSGYKVSTEREVACDKWLGSTVGIGGKKPDVLLLSDRKIWWVEVEKSRKNANDYRRLLDWLCKIAVDASRPSGPLLLSDDLRWARIVFVCAPAFEARLCRDLESAGWTKNLISNLIMFRLLYVSQDINFS